MSTPFDQIWERIVEHAGEQFQTQAGLAFRYEIVDGDRVRPSHSDISISRRELARYFAQVHGASTGKIAALSGGPSFVWSILTDRRILDSRQS